MAMSRRTKVKVVLVVSGVAIAAVVVVLVRREREIVVETTETIRAQLDELDPVARAAVRAQLAEDTVHAVKRD
jgi:hypothetical protein